MSDSNTPTGPSAAPESLIDYERLLQNALRTLMREALRDVEADGELPGEHHFYIGFWTQHAGVQMSDRLRAQYPEQMVVVIQHQFDGLSVTDEHFTVRLHFGGIPEPLLIPFDAVFRFEDPAVNFALQFGSSDDEQLISGDLGGDISDELSDLEAELGADSAEDEPEPELTAEEVAEREANKVVSLDAFRKNSK